MKLAFISVPNSSHALDAKHRFSKGWELTHILKDKLAGILFSVDKIKYRFFRNKIQKIQNTFLRSLSPIA